MKQARIQVMGVIFANNETLFRSLPGKILTAFHNHVSRFHWEVYKFIRNSWIKGFLNLSEIDSAIIFF